MKGLSVRSDAEACGKILVEILLQRREKLWRKVFADDAERERYVYAVGRLAFHWAKVLVAQESDSAAPS